MIRLVGHPDLPEGFSLYEVNGETEFPAFVDLGHPTHKVSYLIKHSPTDDLSDLAGVENYGFRVNISVKEALVEFKRHLAERK